MSQELHPLDPRDVAAAEASLRWEWTESGFRVALPHSPHQAGLSWGAAAAVGMMLAFPIGMLGYARPEVGRELVPLLMAQIIAIALFVVFMLTYGSAGSAPRRLLYALSLRNEPPLVLEVRGETLLVDGTAWPLSGLRRIAFHYEGGHARLELDTPFRHWTSPPIPHRVGRAQQAVLVRWLRHARDRSRHTVGSQQQLRERARAATQPLVERAVANVAGAPPR